MTAIMRTDSSDRSGSDQRWALAAIVALLALVAAVGIALYRPAERSTFNWRSLGFVVHAESAFEIGGVAFGMTPAKVRRLRPASRVGTDAFGRTVLSFHHDGADYTVWFLDQRNGQQAYRIRLVRGLPGAREDEVLAALADRFGRPATGDCERLLVANNRDCSYTWRVSEVAVSALLQTPPPVGPADTVVLRLTAENVMLAARMEETKPRL